MRTSTDIARGTNGRQSADALARADAEKKLSPLERVKYAFDRAQREIAEVCPRHVDAGRVVRLAIAAAARDTKLLECTPASILMGTLQAASLGLEPNTSLQHAFLVPRKNRRKEGNAWKDVHEATFQMGYRGYIVLAHQAGSIAASVASPVFARDTFRAVRGIPHDIFTHEVCEERDPGELRGAYCLWTTPSGARDFLYWPAHKIYDHRDRFAPRKMYDDNGQFIRDPNERPITGPWSDNPIPMGVKSVVIASAKNWPLSSEKLRQALSLDAHAEGSERPALTFVPLADGNAPERARAALVALGEDDPGQQVIDPSDVATSDTSGAAS